MAMMTANVELVNNTLVELTGDSCKVWVGFGLPTYEGPIAGLATQLPEVMDALIAIGALKGI